MRIDAGTDNNYVSLAATGGDTVIARTGKDTVDVATADGAHYYNLISISGGANLINNSNILHSTIVAGEGADTIITGGYYASIDAGDNDFLGESAVGSSISLAADGASNLTDISSIVYDSIGTAVLTFDNDAGKTLSLQNAAGLTFVINDTARIFGENAIFSTDQNSVTLTSAYSGDIDASLYTNFDASALDWQVVLLGTLTLKNFTATTFNVNGDSYQISEGKFVNK